MRPIGTLPLTPPLRARIEPCDDPAGGFFAKSRHQRMHKGRTRRHKQPKRKPKRKAHMLEKGFIDLCGMIKKEFGKHGVSPVSVGFRQTTVTLRNDCPKIRIGYRSELRYSPTKGEYVVQIDDIDRRILNALQRDASQSLESLGESVGLSRNACWRRMRLLEEAGVIKARVALLDAAQLGLGLTVFMQIRTNTHAADWLEKFSKATRALPEILGVYRMTGDLDYLIRARVADMADYDRLYQKLIKRVPLSDVSASFVMEEIKETTALPL